MADTSEGRTGHSRAPRLPAEWEPHAATWLAWPTSRADFGQALAAAEREFVELVRALVEGERVELLVSDRARSETTLGALAGHTQLVIHELSTAEPYVRDTGPTFVVDAANRLVAVDWQFDAWGRKFPASLPDDRVAAEIAARAEAPCVRSALVLEGGALDVDGRGNLLATRTTLLDPVRNPDLGEPELRAELERLLGIETVIWLDGSVDGDDTDGHVDNLARFVAPGHVVHLPGVRGLQDAVDGHGRKLETTELPPPPALQADGRPLPASYANFYLANGAILVPRFGVPEDREACSTLAHLFPERRVIELPVRALLRGGGGLHCLTQPQPLAHP